MAKMMMLEVGGMGFAREIRFNLAFIKDSRRAVVMIDESNNVFWVWLGNLVNEQTRKQIQGVLDKLRQNGHETEGQKVGLNCQQTVVIDERNLSDPVVAQNYQQLLSIFSHSIVEAGKFLVDVQAGAQAPMFDKINPRDKAIAGIFIASVLEEYPEMLIGRTSKGEYALETDRPLIKFKVVNGAVQLMPESINLTDKMKKVFAELFNFLS